MDINLMLVGSKSVAKICHQPRNDVMALVTSAVGSKDYGNSIDSLFVSVVIQDYGMIPLGIRISRKKKQVEVDVELSHAWVKNASVEEIKLALLGCLLKGVKDVGSQLNKKDDDFNKQSLAADLEALATQWPGDALAIWDQALKHQKSPVEMHQETPDRQTLVVQYRIEGWGSPQDLGRRHAIETLLDEHLRSMKIGYCDGGDIGGGTMNVFLYVTSPRRAAKSIVDTLDRAGLIDGATIALETEDGFKVLWPKGFVGEFSYSY